jgi:hypothetical protein
MLTRVAVASSTAATQPTQTNAPTCISLACTVAHSTYVMDLLLNYSLNTSYERMADQHAQRPTSRGVPLITDMQQQQHNGSSSERIKPVLSVCCGISLVNSRCHGILASGQAAQQQHSQRRQYAPTTSSSSVHSSILVHM